MDLVNTCKKEKNVRMRQKKRSPGFIFKTLGVFALLFAVGGLSALSFAPYPNESTHAPSGSRFMLQTPGISDTSTPGAATTGTPGATDTSTPGVSDTSTPGASDTSTPGASDTSTPGASDTTTPGLIPPGPVGTTTPSATGTSGTTAPGQQTYIGAIPNTNNAANMTWVALSSSNGTQMSAFVTDGTANHPPTFAHWYNGKLQNNKFSAPAGLPNAGKIDATLTSDTATGTITLPDGKTLPFTADAVSSANASMGAGLYKTEQVVNGVDYVISWILAPNPATNPSATPSATGTGAPSMTPTAGASPSVTLSPTAAMPGATGTAGILETPGVTGTAGILGTPGVTGTAGILGTPGATGTVGATSTPTISGIVQAGAMYNKQTKTVSSVPDLTSQDIQAKQVTIPNLGAFNLMQCQTNVC